MEFLGNKCKLTLQRNWREQSTSKLRQDPQIKSKKKFFVYLFAQRFSHHYKNWSFSLWPSVTVGHNAGFWTPLKWWNIFSKIQQQLLLIELRTPLPKECDFVSEIAKNWPGCLSFVWAMITWHVVVILVLGMFRKVIPDPSPLLLRRGGFIDFGDCKLKWHFYDWEIHNT